VTSRFIDDLPATAGLLRIGAELLDLGDERDVVAQAQLEDVGGPQPEVVGELDDVPVGVGLEVV
jgi:hypothetical protein